MTASEKLTGQILDNARAEAAVIAADAEKKAKSMTDAAAAASAVREKELCAAAEKKAERFVENAKSAAALYVRNAVLCCRRDEIGATVKALEEHLVGLPDSEYFKVLERLISSYATGEKCICVLNSRDKMRLPQSFAGLLSEKNITVAETADDSIVGGFILKYGDIEYNCCFDALIADRREQVEDIISRELF